MSDNNNNSSSSGSNSSIISGPSPKDEAADYLRSLLNKNLRVTTTDGRMFWGSFKCTDPESNVILQHTYEYRHPTPQQLSKQQEKQQQAGGGGTIKMDMISRYLGLVVVPGKYIVKIELEEFASQIRGRKRKDEGGTSSAVVAANEVVV